MTVRYYETAAQSFHKTTTRGHDMLICSNSEAYNREIVKLAANHLLGYLDATDDEIYSATRALMS